VLAAAKEGTVKRWLQTLLDAGCLEFFESEDGYRLIRVGDASDLPRLTGLSAAPARRRERDGTGSNGAGAAPDDSLAGEDAELFERLRAWRAEKARELSLPPYTIAHDRALREIAALRPTEMDQLLDVTGIGPVKIEKYGDDLLTLIKG
jgi:superfamily II DNA helicase RecQ